MTSRWARALVLAIAIAGCGEPITGDDGGTDAPRCEAPDAFAIGSPDGHPAPLSAPAGEARAGRVTADDLPPDPSGLATWAAGDYVLANDRFALVISQPGRYEVYDPHGGRVRGVARVEAGAMIDPADFNVAILGVGRFVVATESVTVLADGSDGGPAIVRAAGTLAGIEALGDLLDAFFPGDFTGLPAALDYVLEPGAETIETRISVRTGGATARIPFGTAAFFQSYRMPIWNETTGFVPSTESQRFVVFEDADATSYAWVAPRAADGSPGTVSPLLSMSGFDFFTAPTTAVPPCTERTIVLGRFAIGEGVGMNGVQRVLAREARDHDAAGAGDADERRPRGDRGRSRARGRSRRSSPHPGDRLRGWRLRSRGDRGRDRRAGLARGRTARGPLRDPGDRTDDDRARAARDGADRRARRDDGGAAAGPRPALPGGRPAGRGPREPRGALLERGRARLEFTGPSGHVDLRVAPGAYRLVVSRGWEMERHDQMLDLAAGAVVDVTADLARAFETPGLMCADYHIHTHRSVDSADTSFAKVSALVADGLEIAIRSEHEWVSDFQPVIDTLGLGDFVIGLTGEELTTFTYGHFGVFPLEVDANRPSGGAISWYDRLAPEVFADARARPESPLVIVNHPRAGGIAQGYFREVGYDPVTGTVAHPENWDEALEVVEVLNAGDFEANRDGTVQDWFSLLRSGRRVMMVGSSDSHRITGDPVGYPRTCLSIGEDDPRALTPALVRDVTRAGASFVTGGIYLEIAGPSGIGPGESASGVGARTSIDVVVRAASFLDVDRLEVFVDGLVVETIPITETDRDATDPTIRLRATLEVDVAAAGSFVVLHASGTDEPDIVYGGRPFAVSNPLFLTR